MKWFLSAMGLMALSLLLVGSPRPPRPHSLQVNVGADGNSVSALNVPIAMSSDGRYILFDSGLSPFSVDDTNDARDAYVRDMQTGAVERVNVSDSGAQATRDFSTLREVGLDISDDGRFVLFGSPDALAPGAGTDPHYYVRDRQAGRTNSST